MRRAFASAVLIAAGCFTSNGRDSDGGDASCTLFGCVDSGPFIDPFGDASLAIRTRALFGQTCSGGPESGCHSEKAASFTLTLDPDGGDTINVVSTEMPPMFRVKPFGPDQSYLYWKVAPDPRIVGGAMPLNFPFDPRIPALIGDWIEAGAP